MYSVAGNEKIHRLTQQKKYQLRIDVETTAGKKLYAIYDTFRLSDKADHYRLRIGGYSGDMGKQLVLNIKK